MPTRRATTPNDLDALADLWSPLEASATLPTQTFDWAQAAARGLPGTGTLHVLGVEEGGGAVAPLAMREGRLELLGVHALSEPTDLLAASSEALDALARALVRTRRPLHLRRLPAEGPTATALERAAGRLQVRPLEPAPRLRLESGWCEPEQMLASRRRADLRRAARRAEEVGPLKIVVEAPGADDVEPLLDAAWAVEARSWRAARGGALAQDALRGPFFRDYCRRAAASGVLRIGFLSLGETEVAVQIAVASQDAFWLLKVGYDEAHKRCSPGLLLTAATIRHAAEAELASYEFLGVVEPWTRAWTEEVRETISLRTFPFSWHGARAFATDARRALAQRMRRGDA